MSSRIPIALAAALAIAGCGGGAGPDDGPVRALMQRYLTAMMTRHWAAACAQLTPEAAAARHAGAPSEDCATALAFDAGAGLEDAPPELHLHPEEAGQEFEEVKVLKVVMHDRSAQVFIETHPGDEVILLAVLRQGRWLLAQDLEPGIPIETY